MRWMRMKLRDLFQWSVCVLVLILSVSESPAPPVANFIDLTNANGDMPARLVPMPPEQTRIHEGFLDVTKAPYNADNTGTIDCTAVLQEAIDDALDCGLITFLPSGTYLCSDSLHLFQEAGSFTYAPSLIGSTEGSRPVLKLADNSVLTPTPFLPDPYPVFVVAARVLGTYPDYTGEKGESLFGCTIQGIDIDMGNNPGNTAMRMKGAQNCWIEDIHIYGQDFAYGIGTTPGGGGAIANIKVTGGTIGIILGRNVPNATGITLENQSLYGLEVSCVGPGVISEFSIKSPASPSAEYCAVYANNTVGGFAASSGNPIMQDGTIEVSGTSRPAVYSWDQDIYLQNVYVKAPIIVSTDNRSGSPQVLAGDPNNWLQVTRYVSRTTSEDAAIMIDGNLIGGSNGTVAYNDPLLPVSEPPTNLVGRHVWNDATFPSCHDPDRVDIRDFGAIPELVPNSTAYDNAPAINAALKYTTTVGSPGYGKPVVIPRGFFNISSEIIVPAGGKLIGASMLVSKIGKSPSWKPTSPVSSISTVDDPMAEVVLADFCLIKYMPREGGATYPDLTSQALIRDITVQSGKTLWRNIGFNDFTAYTDYGQVATEPEILITGNGGGWFHTIARAGGLSDEFAPGSPAPDFCKVRVSNTTMPVRFYQLNICKLNHNGVGIFENAQDVNVYGWKTEMRHDQVPFVGKRLLTATNVAHLSFLGSNGKYQLREKGYVGLNGACEDVRIANLSIRNGEADSPIFNFVNDYATGDSAPDNSGMCLFAKDSPHLELYAGDSINYTELFDGGNRIDFGTMLMGGGSTQKTFTVLNEGFANLSNLVVTVDGVNSGDFVVSALGSTTLTPGSTTTFTVTFTPSAIGSRTAAAHIDSNDPGTIFDINLVGEGDDVGAPNQPPLFSSDSINNLPALENVSYNGSINGFAFDPDGDALTYSKVSGPAWLSVAADGTLSGTPSNSDIGENTFTVQVDATGGSDTATLTLAVDFINDAPSFAGPVTLSAGTNNVAYIRTVAGSATDPDSSDTLTYSLVETPSWFFMYNDGTIVGQPDDGDIGLHTYTLQVRDTHGETDTAVLNITILDINDIPAFTADPIHAVTAIKDDPYWENLNLFVTDTDIGDTLTFSKISGPAWLTVASDGILGGTPGVGDVGTNTWTVQVSDGAGGIDTATLNITVDSYSGALTSASLPMLDAALLSGNDSSRDIPQDWTDELSIRNDILDGSRTSLAMIKVDTSSLTGTVVSAKFTAYNNPTRANGCYIFGVHDAASFQDWTGGTNGTATYNSVHDNGLFTAKNSLWQGDPSVTLLGSKQFPRDDNNDLPISAYGQAMVDFLNSDTDGLVTFVFCSDVDLPAGIRPHTHANAPTLEITMREGKDPVFGADPIYGIGGVVNAAYTGTLSGSATDVDPGDTLTYSKVSGPAWLSVASNGTLSGTPALGDVGANTFTVKVEDATLAFDTATLNITVKTAPLSTDIYEAEDAVYGGSSVGTEHAGYTGTGYVDYADGGSTAFVEWTFDAVDAGNAVLAIAYASGSTDRPLEIQLNGQVVSTQAFGNTGGWTTWGYEQDLNVTVNQGNNTLRASATGSSGANLDHLLVKIFGSLVPNMTYEYWLSDYRSWLGSETNKTDNKDGDSANNLVEYALGGNPTNSTDTGIAPTLEIGIEGGSNYVEYIHVQRKDSDDLQYHVETTTDLVSGTWTNINVQITGTNTAYGVEGFDAVTNRIPAEPIQQFIRLQMQ